MEIRNRKHIIFRGALDILALTILILAVIKMPELKSMDLVIFLVFLPVCIFIGNMVINVGSSGNIDLSDSIAAYIFITLGQQVGIVFTAIYALVLMFIREKYIIKRNDFSLMNFNIAMYIVTSHISWVLISRIMGNLGGNSFYEHMFYSVGFIVIYIILNILAIKLDYWLETNKKYVLAKETNYFLLMNIAISSFIAITLCEINKTSGFFGTILVLGNILMLHYCFHIFRESQIKNVTIRGLLKITEDIIKYGEFREKCKHLIKNLKELIPYTICSIYTFDVDNDGLTFPIAYDAPEGIGIGDLYFDLSSKAVTIQTIKDGKIYISRDIKKDQNIRFSGKIVEYSGAAIILPVLIGGKVVGAIFIFGGKNLVSFVANGINDLLNILANQMALAIENDGIYREMMNKADIDPLTRLYNRRVLDREIDMLINSNTQFSLVMYDIDDFKLVNDTNGHLAGDEVLKNISEIIRRSIRKTDVACRYGGEEIIIIFKDLSKADAYVISERIRNNIERASTIWDNKNIYVTVSGGVSSYIEDGKTKNGLIKCADDILYSQCKRMGKNKVCTNTYEKPEIATTRDHI